MPQLTRKLTGKDSVVTGQEARKELVDNALIDIGTAMQEAGLPAKRHERLVRCHQVIVDEIITLRQELEALQPQPEPQPGQTS